MDNKTKKILNIGLLLNPIAGMGGKYALKGTDGVKTLEKALKMGATPITPERTKNFLFKLMERNPENYFFITAPGIMGQQIFEGFPQISYKVIDVIINDPTTALDTIKIVNSFCKSSVNLILFVGGDGTSSDVLRGLTKQIPIIGIPSGVKTYGEVFSHNIEETISIIEEYYREPSTHEVDILDLDEEEYRNGNLTIKVKGKVTVPNYPEFFQQTKSPSFYTPDNEDTIRRITDYLIEKINDQKINQPIIIGPGSTFKNIKLSFGNDHSLLGVDVYFQNKNVLKDATEEEIYNYCFTENSNFNPFLIVTPIGGQGYVFGRGNHQLSPRILKKMRKEHIWIVATKNKLRNIQGEVLRVDTRNEVVDAYLCGYTKVITDREEYMMVKIIH